MPTQAFLDGRAAGRLGAPTEHNPYPHDPVRAKDWNKGYAEGRWYHRADTNSLMAELLRLEALVKKVKDMP